MNHCKDCKHFGDEERAGDGWRICRRPDSAGALFEGCLTLETADVLVSPNFGCIQFERKAVVEKTG